MRFRLQSAALVLLTGILSACSDAPADELTPQSFAALTPPEVTALIEERAAVHHVRAASITYIDGESTLTHGVGGVEAQSLLQAASLSKAVAAAGILRLMERENIDIDADIRSRFTSLDISALPGGNQPLTVRELLSHTAGATQGGYPGYRRGSQLPTSAEIILDPPHQLVSSVVLSGEKGAFDYSGGGYQIAQLLAEDIFGQNFSALMQDLILTPLGMAHSTFAQPVDPASIAPLTIVGADSKLRIREGLFRPLKNSWHNYPEQAAAGLWTTSADYARFIQAVMDAAAGNLGPLSPAIGEAMLTPIGHPTWAGENERYGLGILLELNAASDVITLSHSGLNAGYRSLFRAQPQTGRIALSLSNTPGGAAFNQEIVAGLLLMPQP